MLSELHIRNIDREDKGRWVAAARASSKNLSSWVIKTLNESISPELTEQERFIDTEFELKQPSAEQIKEARLRAGLTQQQAATLVHAGLQTWKNWESATSSFRNIPLAAWELFLIKIDGK